MIIMFSAEFMLIMIGLRENFISKSDNQIYLSDEVCVILVVYHLICSTDFVASSETRSLVGWSMIVTTVAGMTAMLARVSFMTTVRLVFNARRLYYLKKKAYVLKKRAKQLAKSQVKYGLDSQQSD